MQGKKTNAYDHPSSTQIHFDLAQEVYDYIVPSLFSPRKIVLDCPLVLWESQFLEYDSNYSITVLRSIFAKKIGSPISVRNFVSQPA